MDIPVYRRNDDRGALGTSMDTAIGISDSDLDAGTKMVLDIIREKGKAWIVGGWIRDRILDIPELEDIDIATNLKPNEILEIFPNSIMIGEKFGTVIVRLEDDSNQYSQEWEVTTLRSEGRYSDGRRPDSVEFGDDIYADLSRRDFTINAMAIDDKWNIIDKYGGKEDLEENILRCVGNAQNRLQEDGLRIMRAFRFVGLKDGRILHFDDELGNALIENLDMLDKVSRERIESEFRKILELDKRMEILSMMNKFGVLKKIFPSLEIDLDVELSDDYRVNLALISRNYVNEKIELSQILRGDLKISNKNMIMIQFLHNNGQRMPRIDKSELRRFRAYLSEDHISCLFKYLEGMGIDTSELMSSIEKLEPLKAGNKPLVNGNILVNNTGLVPGFRLGKLKGWLHRKQIEGNIGEEEEVLQLLDEIDWEDSDPEDWPSLSWP